LGTIEAAASGARWRRRERLATGGLLSGPLVWLLLFFVVPVGFIAAYSVGAVGIFPTDAGVISLDDWVRFLGGNTIYTGLFWKSVRMSLVVSVTVVLLAYPLGYFIALCATSGSTCSCS
jgi:ABC-type spermidine/putrescine transport system permease subunit I